MADVDSEYRVETRDWPVGTREGDPTEAEVFEVLDQFDRFYDTAVQSLADA